MNPLQQAVALVFRRRGGNTLTATDFRHVASFDLKWFPPKEAARLVDAAIRGGLVEESEGRLRVTFDVHRVEVPMDFRPGPEVLDPPAGWVSERIVAPPTDETPPAPASSHDATLPELLASAAGVTPEELRALARAEQDRAQGLLGEETAMLLAARRRGADVRAFVAKR